MSTRAIFFTKDRPMQMRAMLESFQYNCKKEIPISVIISYRYEYDDIIQEFNGNWYHETNGFGDAFTRAVLDCNEDYILFGVDDQLIVGELDTDKAELAMSDPDMQCFSYRLGRNIDGFEYIEGETTDYGIKYDWLMKPSHWGYPFSLDSNVYRKKDVARLLNDNYRVPADLEAFGYPYYMANGKDYMSCLNSNSIAICQDLNKVQKFHGAPMYGDPAVHDEEVLIGNYMDGKRLDWKSAQGFVYTDPFVRDKVWKIN